MRMDLAGERFQVEEHYQVLLPPGNHLIVVAGAHFGAPAYNFDHPNVAAKKSELAEFKHYRRSGSKFWTAKAEISFFFVLPKAQIELVPEKGYNWVPVLIRGKKCDLSVTGVSDQRGWTDYVHQGVHIACGWRTKGLKLLAEIAISPAECQAQGITLDLKPLDDHQRGRFMELATAVTMRGELKPGSQVLLRDRYSYCDSQGPFAVEIRPPRQRHYVCATKWGRVRVQYAAIDWPKTAEANGVAIPAPVLENRIAPAEVRAALEPVCA